MNFLQYFHLTVRKLAAIFCAKTTHFDVIMIRKMNFQALIRISQKSQFWSKVAFFSPKKLNFTFFFGLNGSSQSLEYQFENQNEF